MKFKVANLLFTAVLVFTLMFTNPGVTPARADGCYAIDFDGVDDYIQAGTPGDLPGGDSSYTIEAWFKPDTVHNSQIVGWGNFDTSNQATALRLRTDAIQHFWRGNELNYFVSAASLVGTWHHVAITYDTVSGTRTIYLDGTLRAQDTVAVAHAAPAGTNFRIGSIINIEHFNGQIDEVRIWNVARTTTEIVNNRTTVLTGNETGLVALYRMGEGAGTSTADNASTAFNGTLTNGPTWVTTGGSTPCDPNPPSLTSFAYQTPATSPTNADSLVFRATFSEDTKNVDINDFSVNGATSAGVTNVNAVDAQTYDITVSGGDLASFDGTVELNLAVGQNIQDMTNNALPTLEPGTDQSYLVDNTHPMLTVPADITGVDATGPAGAVVTFTATANDSVDGAITPSCTPISGSTFSVGTTMVQCMATDTAGNSTLDSFDITVVNDSPSVTVSTTTSSPTSTSPIPVTITFSEQVSNFDNGDITVGNGTASNFDATNNPVFTVDITPSGTSPVTVTVSVAASVAQDIAGNNSTASNVLSIVYDTSNPVVASTDLQVTYNKTGPNTFFVAFNKAVNDPAGNVDADDVTNPANFRLINKGNNGAADTTACNVPVAGDDTIITVTGVSYNNTSFNATVTLGSTLGLGTYRLFVCGTTSIMDTAGNELNGGSDYTFDFEVLARPSTTVKRLPDTGFPMGIAMELPAQPADKAYVNTDLMLEIPSINVKTSIVGVPQSDASWDVTWLGEKAGWLNGSAFPTWDGNSVITAHVWDALNQPGPFVNLKTLKYGDKILVHAFGNTYVYEVRETKLVSTHNVSTVMKHEDSPWVTLVTCETYRSSTGDYTYRRIVRAVLSDVK